MSFIRGSDGAKVKISPFAIKHIRAVHSSKLIPPSYFTRPNWHALIAHTVEFGVVVKCDGGAKKYSYVKQFDFCTGFSPAFERKVNKVCTMVRKGILITAYPFR